jgi:fructose-bisphosphate aldolase class I
MPDLQQLSRFETGQGFLAALDQSGGSTPKALSLYGVDESQYSSESEMFDLIQAERVRIITSSVFASDRILGAILFEDTLNRQIEGQEAARYLWAAKKIVPFLKIDKGLEKEQHGVQLMRSIPNLENLLGRARSAGVLGTKERSFIRAADEAGIAEIVAQQFELAERVLAADLVPILEPEIDINSPDKAEAEEMLKASVLERLDTIGDRKVALKVTIPTVDGFYDELIAHPRIARVLALSGGYPRDDANARLARNPGLIASFSRALLDGLSAGQSDEEFDRVLDISIESIYRASIT